MFARILLGALTAAAVSLPVLAAGISGTVVDKQGKPIRGARVCYAKAGESGLCSETDADGYFALPSSRLAGLTVKAKGYMVRTVSAANQLSAITLEPAGSLLVRLRDGDGEPLEGELFLIEPSGRRNGPFPANRNGVHIKTLPPGYYRLIARVEGFAQERSVAATLEPLKETEREITLVALPQDPD